MKHARLTKSLWVLGAVAIVALIAFAGCTFVGDNVTGVKAGAGPTSCVKQCNDLYKTLYDQEQKTHDTNNAGPRSRCRKKNTNAAATPTATGSR